MAYRLYGIKNCDSVKKARRWLDAQAIPYQFHDYSIEGIEAAQLERWCAEQGWNILLNKMSTSFRALDLAQREHLDQERAIALMLHQPKLIKRPILDLGHKTLVGFKLEDYAAAFKALTPSL
ncbi:arsenate reductase [Azomonas agilis]|uniref:Arsenate reductase n=1 Tax=Azomonas agilis TaxID=116849 RepID=A0A562I0Z2_9GAMM|nr:ArsC family reductase [Azomonas agilis]TWH64691.1 arsenate reductase [Azomonas agilis]